MNRTIHNTLITLTAGLVLLSSQSAIGDDTEIYLGTSPTPSVVRPNLTFIIDTSGSMDTDVTITTTNGTYNPATVYSGSCNAGRVYWSTDGTPPACNTNRYFTTSANKCANSVTALNSTGFYVGRLARYNVRNGEDRWEGLSTSEPEERVECLADWGVHGESGATNPYPANENSGGPWRANATNAINWNNTGDTYTLYSANYLNWRASAVTVTTKTRLQIVKEVFSNLMDSVANVNVAVMRYDARTTSSANKGGYFVMPMQQLTAANKANYKTAVNNFTANGFTPLSETMYESYLYYSGGNVKFGNTTTPGTNVSGVLEPGNSAKYKSPIEYQCQKNFTILLTDGEPTYDTDANTDIQALPGFSTVTGAATCNGNCLDELTQYMYAKDCSALTDKQNVISYVIGFTLDLPLLRDAATKGGGKYYTADDTAGLTDAFTSILTEIMAINTTFIAPAVSVNAFNRFEHRDELYYALFRPSARPIWDGNIKRFRLASNPPRIVDKNGDDAIDANTGFFKPSATSYWTADADAPDGDDVKKGGAASRLALPRSVYTYTSAVAPTSVTGVLNSTSNSLHEDNTAITKGMLGDAAMSDDDRVKLIKWARGVDLLDSDSDTQTDDTRRSMGDPLHAKPVLITYGGTDANPDITLFAGTNEGALHAINTTNGSEIFAFMPQELLPNLKKFYEDSVTTPHPYGLDGPLTTWVNDLNGNGVLYNSSGVLESKDGVDEHAYLYQGMRRGGRNYYALNVTDRASPKLKWVIKGGTGTFSELGQSWSAATRAKVKLNGSARTVLLFGGGYDPAQDDNATAQNDTMGRAIFMVDADTGAKLWQAGPAGSANGANPDLVLGTMTNSIPADLTVIDTNNDGYADRIYTADMRGQVWRFDFNIANTGASNFATGGIIARLGDNTAAGNRRFYHSPDISFSKQKTHINVAIGSGYREHPLDTTIRDAFFVIRDPYIYRPQLDANGNPVYTAITMSDLYDATSNTIGEGTATEVNTALTTLASKKGWYIWLQEPSNSSFIGEKVLSKSLTLSGVLIFSTYTPIAQVAGACSPSQGRALTYAVNINNGTPIYDLDSSGGSPVRADRTLDMVRGGIPPQASLIFRDEPVLLIGTEVLNDKLDHNDGNNNNKDDWRPAETPVKQYWRTE